MILTEVERAEGFRSGEVLCKKCGKEMYLFFSDGELDVRDCCGYRYRTEHVRIDLVIYRIENEDVSVGGEA